MMARWPFWPTLVLICFLTLWNGGQAQIVFTIDWVKLTLLPGTTVERGSNLTLRCEVKVSHSSSHLMHTLRFLKYETVIYSKNTSEAVVDYSLIPARASHSGLYQCQVQIFQKEMSSKQRKLTVTGMQTPHLKVQTNIVKEGDEIVATCSAPEETDLLNIFFYMNNQELQVVSSKGNSASISVKAEESGSISLHCNYMFMLNPTTGRSNNSNTVHISVKELEITPSIRIFPNETVVEGHRVYIDCNVSNYFQSDLEVFLTKDTVLNKEHHSFSYSFVATANVSGEYVCKTERGYIQKSSKAQLKVVELFSRPVLSMIPKYVFEDQPFNLTCRSLSIFEAEIAPTDVKYRLYKDKQLLKDGHDFSTLANQARSGSYYCEAEAKGITKASMPLLVKVKVPVSVPVIQSVGRIIVRQPFQLQCESEHGTLPITYTLLKFQEPVAHMTVTGPKRTALFNVSSISHRNEIHSFTCLAENQELLFSKLSLSLNTTVLETVSTPDLTISKGNVVTEGENVILTCNAQQGTVPITFSWYRAGVAKPLNTTQISKTQGYHIIKSITRDDEGRYYCQASNYANVTKKSPLVKIEVNLASWKKALIGVSCIFLWVIIVIILVIFLKKAHTPRKKNKRAVELSVKPARTKSDDPMRVSLTLDFEDNTAGNATPGIMGRTVWTDRMSSSESDEECEKEESEKSQNAEEQPLRHVDSGGEPVMDDTETGKCDLQDITQDETDQVDQTDLEYVQLNKGELEPV